MDNIQNNMTLVSPARWWIYLKGLDRVFILSTRLLQKNKRDVWKFVYSIRANRQKDVRKLLSDGENTYKMIG